MPAYRFFYVFLQPYMFPCNKGQPTDTKNMKTILTVLAVTMAALGLMMAGLGIKMLFHKEKEFKRSCANADPKTGRCQHCTCGKNKE